MPQIDLKYSQIFASYLKSLVWIATFVAIAAFFQMCADVLCVDFLHVNPHRTQSNAGLIPLLFTPFVFVIVLLVLALSFGVTQLVQALLTKCMIQKFRRSGLYAPIIGIPLWALLSWYCYDYLTLHDFNLGINEGPEWIPYHHGLTFDRYLIMLLIQSGITLFSFCQLILEIKNRPTARKNLLLALAMFASIAGALDGALHAHIVR